jgi:predicted DCC family thiol-disulfide oxidoreductase YuxK
MAMAPALGSPWWNPLRLSGTPLPVPVLLMAKLIAVALLLTNHQRLLPDPFLPFVSWLEPLSFSSNFQVAIKAVFIASALALILNCRVRTSAFVLGATILLSVVASKAYYGNNKTMCGILLVMAGMWERRFGTLFIRLQFSLVYFGAGLNKLLDPDWQSGQFFHHWATVRLKQPVYTGLAPMLPDLMLAKAFCFATIAVELALSSLWFIRPAWPRAIWLSLLFHAALLEFTGTTFTMFFYAMEAAVLAFVAWPRELIVIYDGECGICNDIRRWWSKLDFDGAYLWRPLQSDVGARFGIARAALEERLHFVADGRVYAGFHACKMILLYNPVTSLLLVTMIALPPEDWRWWRRVAAGLALAFFLPAFNAVGERAYAWVARNRHRFSSSGACAIDPAN